MVEIKKESAEPTAEELRSRIFENITSKDIEIENCFTKYQLQHMANKLGAAQGFKCYFCDENKKECLERHHIVPRSMGGPDIDRNLVTLCATCHRKLESLYNDNKLEIILEHVRAKSQRLDSKQELAELNLV